MACQMELVVDVIEEEEAEEEEERRADDDTGDSSGEEDRIVPLRRGSGSTTALSMLRSPLADKVRGLVSQQKVRWKDDMVDLDLSYITPRIIAMGFPSHGTESLYRNPIDQVEQFLDSRHGGRYKVYNLCSERQYDSKKRFGGNWERFPWDDHHPPMPFSIVPSFLADCLAHLSRHPQNVVAVHCKAGKSRTGTLISCLLMHLHPDTCPTPEEAMQKFAAARTSDGNGVTIPSQRRYVSHWARSTLSRALQNDTGAPHTRITRAKAGVLQCPIKVRRVSIHNLNPPGTSVRIPFFKIKLGDILGKSPRTIFNSKRHWTPASNMTSWDLSGRSMYGFDERGVLVNGDVKLDVRDSKPLSDDPLFRICFNVDCIYNELRETSTDTCHRLVFEKHDIDVAHKDRGHKKFPSILRVEVLLEFLDGGGGSPTGSFTSPMSTLSGSSTSPFDRASGVMFQDPDGDVVQFFLEEGEPGMSILRYSVNSNPRPTITLLLLDADAPDYLLFPHLQKGVHLPKKGRKQLLSGLRKLAVAARVENNIPEDCIEVSKEPENGEDGIVLASGPPPLRFSVPLDFVAGKRLRMRHKTGGQWCEAELVSYATLLSCPKLLLRRLVVTATPLPMGRVAVFLDRSPQCKAVAPHAALTARALPSSGGIGEVLHLDTLPSITQHPTPVVKSGVLLVSEDRVTWNKRWVVCSFSGIEVYAAPPPQGRPAVPAAVYHAGPDTTFMPAPGLLTVGCRNRAVFFKPLSLEEGGQWEAHWTGHGGWESVILWKLSLDDVVWEVATEEQVAGTTVSNDTDAAFCLSCCGSCQLRFSRLPAPLSVAEIIRSGVSILPVVLGDDEAMEAVSRALLPFSLHVESAEGVDLEDLLQSPGFPSNYITPPESQYLALFAPSARLSPRTTSIIASMFSPASPVFFAVGGTESPHLPPNTVVAPITSPRLYNTLALHLCQWYSHAWGSEQIVCVS